MATVPIQLEGNSILVHGSVNNQDVIFIIDTGDAVGPVFNTEDAARLQLKNEGSLDVSGAGGGVQIYATKANIHLGGIIFQDEPGAIDSNLQGPSLLGLPFFIKQGGIMAFDFQNNTLSIGSSYVAKSHRRFDALVERWIHHDSDDVEGE